MFKKIQRIKESITYFPSIVNMPVWKMYLCFNTKKWCRNTFTSHGELVSSSSTNLAQKPPQEMYCFSRCVCCAFCLGIKNWEIQVYGKETYYYLITQCQCQFSNCNLKQWVEYKRKVKACFKLRTMVWLRRFPDGFWSKLTNFHKNI